MSDKFLYLTRYKKHACYVIKYIHGLVVCWIVKFSTSCHQNASFSSLFSCHNVSHRHKSFSLPQKGKDFLVLHRTLENQKQTCQHLTPGHRCEAKGVIVHTCALVSQEKQPAKYDDHDHILGSILRFTSGKVYYRPFEDGDQVNKCEFQFECLQISRNCAYMLSTKLLHWR